jgi:transcriptional regulator with XRE-family HTH domain
MKFLTTEEANRRLLFCNNLRDVIRKGPISAAEVAKRIGVATSTVKSYMRGNVFPNEERIQQLADALECTVDDLFDDSDKPWEFKISN